MKVVIAGKEYNHCPQHGYPLPCDKCGLGQYELGKMAGIKEVVEFLKDNDHEAYSSLSEWSVWKAKLKEWGIASVASSKEEIC